MESGGSTTPRAGPSKRHPAEDASGGIQPAIPFWGSFKGFLLGILEGFYNGLI